MLYKQNTQIIAESLREIQSSSASSRPPRPGSHWSFSGKPRQDDEESITELQGMIGGEMGAAMQQLRQAAASGEGQMRATLDLAKKRAPALPQTGSPARSWRDAF